MEGFPSNLNDTFTSTIGCAEPMLSMCQLNVKVTVKCQINQNKIYIHLKLYRMLSVASNLSMHNFPF